MTKKQQAIIEKYTAQMREIAQRQERGRDDPEREHPEADEVLLNLLKELGCAEIVQLFEKLEKWYS